MKTNILKFTRSLAATICMGLSGAALTPAAFSQVNGPGMALDYASGGQGYARIPAIGSMTGTFTVELWAFPTDPTNTLPLIGSREPFDFGFELRLHDGNKIHVDIGNGNNWIINADAAFSYTTGAWYHFACVVMPTGYELLANGIVVGGAGYGPDNPVLFDNQHTLTFGWSGVPYTGDTNEFMIGELDEIRMWSAARTISQIQANMHQNLIGTETGLAGYWPCDSYNLVGGLSIPDSSGHNLDGQLFNVVLAASTAPIGAPVAVTTSAVSTNGFAVTLNGSVTNNYQDARVWFQYGPTANYGSATPTSTVSGGAPEPAAVSALIHLTSVGIPWHYRLVASNSVGVSYGADASFDVDFTNTLARLTGVAGRTTIWADFDNDGKLDVLLTGNGTSQVWRNVGNGVFTNWNAGLPGLTNMTAAVADFDNDGRLDILLSGGTGSEYLDTNCGCYAPADVTQIWHNQGGGVFMEIDPGIPGVEYGSVAVGDLDNDGKADVLLTGISQGCCPTTIVYRNLGNGKFANVYINNGVTPGLTAVAHSAVAVADFDNDGRMDILLTGIAGNGSSPAVSQIWKNLGNWNFANINANLTQLAGGSVSVGDFDNDGNLDIVATGMSATGVVSQIWHNLGGDTFAPLGVGLPGVYLGSAAWGDYDNDGNLDIALSGVTFPVTGGTARISQVWRNLRDNTFANINTILPDSYLTSVAWGDYDNDGRLDLLLTGTDSSGFPESEIWRNLTPSANTPPTAPTGLSAQVMGNGVRLSWNAASDAQTPSTGLSYNIRVGTTPGGSDIVSPESDPATGYRRVAELGNCQERLFALLTNLPGGLKYYWSAQAIDTSYAGSPFAAEGSFMTPVILPILFIRTTSTGQVEVSWPNTGSYTLEQSSTLAPGSWAVMDYAITTLNGTNSVTFTPTPGSLFFRLKQ